MYRWLTNTNLKPTVKLPGWGGRWRGQVRGDLQRQSTQNIHDVIWTQSPWLWTRISSKLSDLCFGTLLLSAMLYGRGRKVLTLCGGSDCSSSDSGVSAAGDTSLSSCPVLVLLALDRKRELEGRGRGGDEGGLKCHVSADFFSKQNHYCLCGGRAYFFFKRIKTSDIVQ